MNPQHIPVVTVSYNAPELLQGLLVSMRRFYANPIHVVDGSDAEYAPRIAAIVAQFENVQLHAMGYNIHHGPGMAWAIRELGFSGPVLFMDTDIVVLRAGFLEALQEQLRPGDYGVGAVAYVNREGFDIEYAYGAIAYLHPPCMLCNVEVMREWPLPVKHGAPMIEAMRALHDSDSSGLLRHLDWCANDVRIGTEKIYFDHIGRGTSSATGGYHLEEWMAQVQAKRAAAAATAAATATAPQGGYNADLLRLMPHGQRRVLEVGCSTGVLAQAYLAQNPQGDYWGLELNPVAAGIARQHCAQVMALDIEGLADEQWAALSDRDCWVFGDVLEHLRNPWRVLARIRRMLPPQGCIVLSVPNAQHWSVQARLANGIFRYEDGGLMDRTHLRWFTRITLLEMLEKAGLRMEAGVPRIFNEPGREAVLPAIRQMAQALGLSADDAVRDALPMQYVVRAVPA